MLVFCFRILMLLLVLAGLQAQPLQVPDAEYGEAAFGRYVRIPVTDCANLTATPVIVGDWLVYPMHEHTRDCSGPGAYQHALFGYYLRDGKLYLLRDDGAGEAPLLYWQDQDLLLWNTTFGGTLFLLDPQTFELRKKLSVQTTSDSAGVVLDGLYYFGTVNSPDDTCQNPVNPNCGALFAVDSGGNVAHALTSDDGFRAWVGTSPTTDGRYLYWGTAAQTVGEKSGDETSSTYGCAVVETDGNLNILASFDPGDLGCYMLPFTGANMDSVSGEVVPDGNGLWVQYVRPNGGPEGAGQFKAVLYRLDLDLQERCRLEFDFEPQTQAAGFYAAPTVDASGNAYVAVSVPDVQATRKGQLWKVTPRCESTLLAEVPGSFAHASPTLADDRYVLFATDGRLQMLTLEGSKVREYALASEARVLAGPVIHEGTVYVVQEDGTLNRIEGSGLGGYGDALWPRYRHDNAGLAVLGGISAQGENSSRTRAGGGLITVHLEASLNPRIHTLWPKLEEFMNMADRYGHKITLQFSPQWAAYVYDRDLLEVVQGWEAAGHEIALHHHGPSHKFYDGYTNRPDLLQAPEWYGYDFGHQGDMAALMAFLAPLSQQGILSAGMSDADVDWPGGVLYYATDSGDAPSRDDLLSVPRVARYNGYPVVEIYNSGYAIDHLGDAAVSLEDVEAGLKTAEADQYVGIVVSDDTLENHFEEVEPLFQLLQRYGLQTRAVRTLLGKLTTAQVETAEEILDAAEARYPEYFPSHQATRWVDPYLYRHYPDTGIYAGVNVDEQAGYLLGGAFGSSLYRVGSVTEVEQLLGLSD